VAEEIDADDPIPDQDRGLDRATDAEGTLVVDHAADLAVVEENGRAADLRIASIDLQLDPLADPAQTANVIVREIGPLIPKIKQIRNGIGPLIVAATTMSLLRSAKNSKMMATRSLKKEIRTEIRLYVDHTLLVFLASTS